MSSPVYVQRGATFRDTFVYQNSDGTFVTGLTQAAFTIKCSLNGANRANTGITIAEVSAGSNPGEYALVLDGATGPAAANGSYTVTVTRTSDPRRTWEQTYIVNLGGTSATSGVAFTATVSNGRAMSGGSPLASATVVITSGGTVFATMTTDASGLWGPVYFVADGTYGVTIQKSGYASATGSITVSSGATSAAGPGTDLTLTASTTNPLSASELWAYFTRMARDVSGGKADIERKQGVQDALDMVAKERQWRWLLRRGYLTFNASVNTSGTFNGTAVVTGLGSVPDWAASGKVLVNQRIYDVLSRDSGTQVTLEAAATGISGSVAVVFFQDEYDLPDNLLQFHQLIPGPWWGWGGQAINPEDFYQRQSAMVYGQQSPSAWCIHQGSLLVAPYPTQSNTIPYTYYARPAVLSSGADIADWDPAQVEVLRRAIDVQVAYRYGAYAGGDAAQAFSRYKQALTGASSTDRTPTAMGSALDIDAYDIIPRTDYRRRTT